MKIKEIIVEDDYSSEYIQNMKNELLNYLSTLSATGVVDPVDSKKLVQFMRKNGYDVTPEQIDDLLMGTEFSADEETVNIDSASQNQQSSDSERKIQHMADKQLKREM